MKQLMVRFAMVFLATFVVWTPANAQDADRLPRATNAYPLRTSGFTVHAEPEWSLDLRGDTSTARVSIAGAALLRNGIVVAERLTPRLLVYSTDRRLVRAVPLKSGLTGTFRIDRLQRVDGDTLAVIA